LGKNDGFKRRKIPDAPPPPQGGTDRIAGHELKTKGKMKIRREG
jgi:hypothetical protein